MSSITIDDLTINGDTKTILNIATAVEEALKSIHEQGSPGLWVPFAGKSSDGDVIQTVRLHAATKVTYTITTDSGWAVSAIEGLKDASELFMEKAIERTQTN